MDSGTPSALPTEETRNPYGTPMSAPAKQTADPKILYRSVGVVVGCCALFGVLGLIVGGLLGALAPNYYRTVFSRPAPDQIDPVAVGIGLGVTQGIVLGGVVGVVLVALFYWYNSRLSVVKPE